MAVCARHYLYGFGEENEAAAKSEMLGIRNRTERDISRWHNAGLIDETTAQALKAEAARHAASRLSFGTVLAMMAAALLGAAILIFVAANWDAMPRLMRVSLLFALLAGTYPLGAWLKMRGDTGFGEAVWVAGAACFGASIALIGQMYHLSGDERQAILIWFVGTGLAAGLLRSPQLTVTTVLLGGVWMMMNAPFGPTNAHPPLAYPVLALALWLLSFWTDSRSARHLQAIALIVYVAVLHFDREFAGSDADLIVPTALAMLGAGLFALDRLRPGTARLLGLGGALPAHALVAFLAGIGMMQLSLIDEPAFLLVCILALAGIVAALLVGGRDSGLLRRLCYAAFIFQLCFLYVVMFGSMLGTAGFFLLVGAALALLAVLIRRMERRFAAGDTKGATA